MMMRIRFALGVAVLCVAYLQVGLAGQDEETVIDGEAKLVSFEDLDYPAVARATRVQGVVVARVEIGNDGRVGRATALSVAKLLIPEAIANAKRWRFDPTGKRSAVIVYEFRIEAGGCHDKTRSLFVLRHKNFATITSCEDVVQP